jgi:hypothetical protein
MHLATAVNIGKKSFGERGGLSTCPHNRETFALSRFHA